MELSPNAFHELAKFIHDETGIALAADKAYLVRHRLEALVVSEGLDSFDALVMKLRANAPKRLHDEVIDAITVKETQFFRDPAFFECLLQHILPQCVSTAHKRVRIWSAATATGQEAYSLALLVRELVGDTPAGRKREEGFSILASDISTSAIDYAKAGDYTKSEVSRGLSEKRLQHHFKHHGSRWQIDESLKALIHFRTFNLLNAGTQLGPFDLILCRNVMIYFDEATRRKICKGMYASLHEGGYLALGSAESLYGMTDRFEPVTFGKSMLYRKPQSDRS